MTNEIQDEMKAIAVKLRTAVHPERHDLLKRMIDIISVEFEPEAIEFVKMIEAKPATTQNRYGDYMNILSDFKGIYQSAMYNAMLRNGANAQGLRSAVEILNQ